MKIVKICGICFFSMLCLVGITQRDNDRNNLIFGLFCGIIVFLLFLSVRHSDRKQREKLVQQANLIAQQNALAEIKKQKLADIESLNLIPVAAPHLLLKQSEIAYIEQPATLTITENKIVGTTGRSSGISMRVAKGMYVRTGGSGGKKIYDDVTTTYDGILSVTNQRISFMQERKAFEIPLNKLTNTTSDDNTIVFQQGNKSYALLTDDADIIECLIRRLCRNQF